MTARELAHRLKPQFGDLLSEPVEFREEVTLEVRDAERIAEVCGFAKTSLGCDFLVDISSVDNYGEDPRWTIVYELYGLEHGRHLRLKTRVSEQKSELPTVTTVWRTADWHEREIYDMMGIRFRGHGDLRRILMWEGYPYFPLRKDFPLAGKATELPEVAFTQPAPLEGGPFVTIAGGADTIAREPRARGSEAPTPPDLRAAPPRVGQVSDLTVGAFSEGAVSSRPEASKLADQRSAPPVDGAHSAPKG